MLVPGLSNEEEFRDAIEKYPGAEHSYAPVHVGKGFIETIVVGGRSLKQHIIESCWVPARCLVNTYLPQLNFKRCS
ncbi:MAG: hypothetical protein DRO12_01795 [Thermoprotei archaeon]|nr:MAG: hypothetical protein DRO12_01795 [Thermoprotei archaeon]